MTDILAGPAVRAFYTSLAAERDDPEELRACVARVVARLAETETSSQRPGMLLGKIQEGKTRAFLGVIAAGFDTGIGGAIVLTKGTRALARQTLRRITRDFRPFVERDQVQVFDIMHLPENLTLYARRQHWIIVAKKEDDNLRRVAEMFALYPDLRERRWLIIDDEADFGSVSYRRQNGVVNPGVLSQHIDAIRDTLAGSYYLQVTATPYALYLQPTEDTPTQTFLFKPKRPAFTELLPSHPGYVGGDHYFEQNTDEASPAYFFYRDVPLPEREALRLEDRRRLKLEDVLTETNADVLRRAIVNFIVGGTVRRLQQTAADQPVEKFAFLFHTEASRASHAWQERVAIGIRDGLQRLAESSDLLLDRLIEDSYADLGRSVMLVGAHMPGVEFVKEAVRMALTDEYLTISRVNVDRDIELLLNDDGELNLRTPLNMFIGGQILDRGITIRNLIGFYYGRNPLRLQQDTVLQHCRMYGARSFDDLAVTRFYSPRSIYNLMAKIHALDTALRDAIETGRSDRGVYFVHRDDSSTRLVPCSPNKILISDVVTLKAGNSLVPSGFHTTAAAQSRPILRQLDLDLLHYVANGGVPIQVDLETALTILRRCYDALEFEDEASNGQAKSRNWCKNGARLT